MRFFSDYLQIKSTTGLILTNESKDPDHQKFLEPEPFLWIRLGFSAGD
jgi:hypothetical protein